MKYFKDFRGYFFLALRTYRLFLLRTFSSFAAKSVFSLKGIKFQNGNQFYGLPKIIRVPFSSIKIGRNNRFRSDASSNLIGINHRCIISTHNKNAIIQIGDNCGFSGVSIGASEKIIIGNSVLFGANSVITDFDWHRDRYNSGSKPIIIHNNVWIGLNTVILKGVEIGENSIIGANSLVIKSIPANVIAGGNPCKVLKEI